MSTRTKILDGSRVRTRRGRGERKIGRDPDKRRAPREILKRQLQE